MKFTTHTRKQPVSGATIELTRKELLEISNAYGGYNISQAASSKTFNKILTYIRKIPSEALR